MRALIRLLRLEAMGRNCRRKVRREVRIYEEGAERRFYLEHGEKVYSLSDWAAGPVVPWYIAQRKGTNFMRTITQIL